MTNSEFSNEFDILYNSITSNQAPGLDEYEKSVFLTKAQDEIVKSYFNPRSNKTQEGFDGNEKRQIDFSMILRSNKYENINFVIDAPEGEGYKSFKTLSQVKEALVYDEETGVTSLPLNYANVDPRFLTIIRGANTPGKPQTATISPFTESFFDMRDNTKAVTLDEDILMFTNEYVEVARGNGEVRLTVLPINYIEYSRLMSKPHKRPVKSQAWRLIDNSDGQRKVEIVVGPNDEIKRYVLRYVKRPRAIRLTDFDDVTLDGGYKEQECELDPILHTEILQRAVELAKASYSGDLNSQIALGQSSQTSIGAVAQQQSR